MYRMSTPERARVNTAATAGEQQQHEADKSQERIAAAHGLSPTNRFDGPLRQEEGQEDDAAEVHEVLGVDDPLDHLTEMLGQRDVLEHGTQHAARPCRPATR